MRTSEAKRLAESSDPAAREMAQRVLDAARRRKEKAAPRRKAAGRKRQTVGEARRETRAVCEERAHGACEAAGIAPTTCGGALEHDHVFGRGKVRPNPELEWMLCRAHHAEKTLNRPSRAAWLAFFERHAARHGYTDAVARCRRALALESAQHPGRSLETEAGKEGT